MERGESESVRVRREMKTKPMSSSQGWMKQNSSKAMSKLGRHVIPPRRRLSLMLADLKNPFGTPLVAVLGNYKCKIFATPKCVF